MGCSAWRSPPRSDPSGRAWPGCRRSTSPGQRSPPSSRPLLSHERSPSRVPPGPSTTSRPPGPSTTSRPPGRRRRLGDDLGAGARAGPGCHERAFRGAGDGDHRTAPSRDGCRPCGSGGGRSLAAGLDSSGCLRSGRRRCRGERDQRRSVPGDRRGHRRGSGSGRSHVAADRPDAHRGPGARRPGDRCAPSRSATTRAAP